MDCAPQFWVTDRLWLPLGCQARAMGFQNECRSWSFVRVVHRTRLCQSEYEAKSHQRLPAPMGLKSRSRNIFLSFIVFAYGIKSLAQWNWNTCNDVIGYNVCIVGVGRDEREANSMQRRDRELRRRGEARRRRAETELRAMSVWRMRVRNSLGVRSLTRRGE